VNPRAASAADGKRATQAGVGRSHGPAADLATRSGLRRSSPFADLEALREAAGLPDSRFAALAGIANDTVIGQAPAPIALVSDNGPCYRGAAFQALFTDHDDPLLRHVRTRVKS